MSSFSGSMVLVDTSVFIHYFRGKEDPVFQELVLNDQVLISDLVRLELLQGVKKAEYKILESSLKGIASSKFESRIIEEAE